MASPTSSSVKLTLNDEITGDAGMGESGSGLSDCDESLFRLYDGGGIFTFSVNFSIFLRMGQT